MDFVIRSMYLPADKPMYQVYKQQKNKLFDRLIYNLRIRFGSVNVEVSELFDVLSSLKQQGKMGMIGLISDKVRRDKISISVSEPTYSCNYGYRNNS